MIENEAENISCQQKMGCMIFFIARIRQNMIEDKTDNKGALILAPNIKDYGFMGLIEN